METETLHHLVASFESDRIWLEETARGEPDGARQAWARHRARSIERIVGRIRDEIRLRDATTARQSGAAERFEYYLERALEAYLDTRWHAVHANADRTTGRASTRR